MTTALRDLVIGDLDEVLQINQGARPGVGDLDMARLQALVGWCAHARVALRADLVVGFLLALEPAQPYASENYRYFESTMTEQVYVDRIAVAESHRGQGIGAALYQDLFERRPDRAICCEVNVVPMNAPSLRFHERLGFESVGEQQTEGGDKRVRLLVRPG